jgi:hypothetical protein
MFMTWTRALHLMASDLLLTVFRNSRHLCIPSKQVDECSLHHRSSIRSVPATMLRTLQYNAVFTWWILIVLRTFIVKFPYIHRVYFDDIHPITLSYLPPTQPHLQLSYTFSLLLFLTALGFELRADHLSHTSSPFCSGYFGDVTSRTICPGWPWISKLPISASQVTRITGVSHQCQLFLTNFYMGFIMTFSYIYNILWWYFSPSPSLLPPPTSCWCPP